MAASLLGVGIQKSIFLQKCFFDAVGQVAKLGIIVELIEPN